MKRVAFATVAACGMICNGVQAQSSVTLYGLIDEGFTTTAI